MARTDERSAAPGSSSIRRFAAVICAAAAIALISPPLADKAQATDVSAAWLGIAGVAAALGLLLLRANPSSSRPTRLGLAWIAFLSWTLLSAVTSGRIWSALVGESTSMLGWATLVALTGIALASAVAGVQVRRLLYRYAWILVLGQSLLALAMVVFMTEAQRWVATGTLSNSTYFGEALLLLLPWVLPARMTARPWERRVRYATAALAVAALAAAGSLVAVAVAAIFLGWMVARRSGLATGRRVALLSVVLVIAAASALIFARFEVVQNLQDISLGSRVSMWRQSALATGARPILGWGPDGYMAGSAAILTPELARSPAGILQLIRGSYDPHNLVAWVAVSTGFVGLALFAWFVVEMTLTWRARMRSGAGIAPAAWGVALCTAVALTAPLPPTILPLFALMLGASLGAPAADEDGSAAGGGRTSTRRAFAAVVIAGALISAILAANAATRAPLEVTGAQVSPPLAPQALAASGFWRLDPHLAYLASIDAAWAAATVPQYSQQRADLTAIERAVSLDRRDPFYALELARTLQFYQEPFGTVDAAYREALRRYPLFPLAQAQYAAYLAQSGRLKEAQAHLDIAVLIADENPERLSAIRSAEDLISKSRP